MDSSGVPRLYEQAGSFGLERGGVVDDWKSPLGEVPQTPTQGVPGRHKTRPKSQPCVVNRMLSTKAGLWSARLPHQQACAKETGQCMLDLYIPGVSWQWIVQRVKSDCT